MSMRTALSLLSALVMSAPALAQSFNIDLGFTGSAASSSFGGAANQPGTWNNITAATPAAVTLTNLDGTPSSITLTRSTSGSFITNANANLTGDYSKLLTDAQTDPTKITYSVSGLSSGFYLVLIYATDVHSATNTCVVTVGGSNGQNTQFVNGPIPTSNFFYPLRTHAINTWFRPSLNDPLTITITPGAGSTAQCAGIQIVALPGAAAARFYVNDNATGDGGGMSWNNAFTSFQTALDVFRLAGPNHEVWVAGGTYKPTTGSDQTASFVLTSHIKYYAGFAGTETDLSQRGDPLLHQTILTGAIGTAADTDNSQLVVDASDTDQYTVFDGFTVARGYNDSASPYAGGMLLTNASTDVRNCRFLYNHATYGGAVYTTGGTPSFVNCYFFQNDAVNFGGALEINNASGTIDLVNCRFYGNESFGNAGAVYVGNSTINAVNCLFTGNSTNTLNYGGGVYFTGKSATGSTDTLTHCTFANNTGYVGGGAVYINDKSSVTIANSILWNNYAPTHPADSQYGAAPGSGAVFTFSGSTIKGFAGLNGQDPLFVNQLGNDGVAGNTDDDLHLSPGSPCIDTGKSANLPKDDYDLDNDHYYAETLSLDLDKLPRRSDILGAPDDPAAGTPAVDRGCYELQMPACPADINSDGSVDLLDFFAFFNAFDQNLPDADVDLSGTIDLSDFFTFFNSFDSGCP